ncbi:hypothetical protein ACFLZY_01555 [Patescibacteria group bacterium]
MHFVYDFDATLYETSRLWQAWASALEALGAEPESVIEQGHILFGQGFTPQLHGERLELSGKDFERILKKHFKSIHDEGVGLVYSDVIPFIQEQADTHKQSILTFGDPEYQEIKILASGISEHISELRFATPDNMKAMQLREIVESSSESVVFIDDNPQELVWAHDAGLSLTLVRIMREGERHAEKPHESDNDLWTCISSLDELNQFM